MAMLTEKVCVPCEGGVEPLSASEARGYAAQVPGWTIFDTYITRTYEFKTFAEALGFVNAVGEIAEREGHHPDITLTYSRVTLTLTTHAIAGLSENDFILAAKIDAAPSVT